MTKKALGPYACHEIIEIHPDFRAQIREQCSKCHGEGGQCALERIKKAMSRSPNGQQNRIDG